MTAHARQRWLAGRPIGATVAISIQWLGNFMGRIQRRYPYGSVSVYLADGRAVCVPSIGSTQVFLDGQRRDIVLNP